MATDLHILFWLNKAKKDRHHKCPLVIRITHRKQRKQLTTSFRLLEQEWSIIESDRKTGNQELNTVKEFIKSFRAKIYTLANKLELENRFTMEELLDLYEGKQNPDKGIIQLIEDSQCF